MTVTSQLLTLASVVLESKLISANNGLDLRPYAFAVLRYLRSDRQVIHRDISKGNVLFIEDQTTPPADVGCGSRSTEPKELHLCFVQYLLEER
jgi:hypothetical protein